MEVIESQQAGLGIFGWLIVVIAVPFLWNIITNKNDDKPQNED